MGVRRRHGEHHTLADVAPEPRPGVFGVPAVTGTREKSDWARYGGPGEEAGGAEASWRTRQECARAREEAARVGWRERPVRSSALGTAYRWAASGGWPGDCPRVSTSSEKREKRQNINLIVTPEENATRKTGQKYQVDQGELILLLAYCFSFPNTLYT